MTMKHAFRASRRPALLGAGEIDVIGSNEQLSISAILDAQLSIPALRERGLPAVFKW